MQRAGIFPGGTTEVTEMITITKLLDRAKQAIESGETSLHAAAEDIAAAREQGATQRQIGEAVGKSAAWVNRLLKWRQSGYQDDTAFGPQAKARRLRAQRVESPEQKKKKNPQPRASRPRPPPHVPVPRRPRLKQPRLKLRPRRRTRRLPRPKPTLGRQERRRRQGHTAFSGAPLTAI